MSEPKNYEIRTVADFLALPADKIDACVFDFLGFLRMVKGAEALGHRLRVKEGDVPTFEWIDDEKHDCTVELHAGGVVSTAGCSAKLASSGVEGDMRIDRLEWPF